MDSIVTNVLPDDCDAIHSTLQPLNMSYAEIQLAQPPSPPSYTTMAPRLGQCIILACSQHDTPWTHKLSERETCISISRHIVQVYFPATLMCSDTVKALLAGLQGPMTQAEASLGVPTMQQALFVALPLVCASCGADARTAQ